MRKLVKLGCAASVLDLPLCLVFVFLSLLLGILVRSLYKRNRIRKWKMTAVWGVFVLAPQPRL